MLNRFFRVVVAVVNREGGWVNKFEGDAALCLFGAPQDQPDHADARPAGRGGAAPGAGASRRAAAAPGSAWPPATSWPGSSARRSASSTP